MAPHIPVVRFWPWGGHGYGCSQEPAKQYLRAGIAENKASVEIVYKVRRTVSINYLLLYSSSELVEQKEASTTGVLGSKCGLDLLPARGRRHLIF
jgi:hypothetical protein